MAVYCICWGIAYLTQPTFTSSSKNLRDTMTPALKYEADSIMASDGLRYTFKGGGSPFKDSANMGTMSCYRCGLHKPRALGSFTRFLNQRTFVCQACAPQPKKSPA